MFSDSIILWHKSEDTNKNKHISKITVDSNHTPTTNRCTIQNKFDKFESALYIKLLISSMLSSRL